MYLEERIECTELGKGQPLLFIPVLRACPQNEFLEDSLHTFHLSKSKWGSESWPRQSEWRQLDVELALLLNFRDRLEGKYLPTIFHQAFGSTPETIRIATWNDRLENQRIKSIDFPFRLESFNSAKTKVDMTTSWIPHF
uniref:SHM2 protein n=1 Tax=Fopius arisanus TaxID=64838 RepID=A0A0C9QYD4_9HYME